MSDVILGINQGDYIYYIDQSTGAESRDWWFQGGTPTGGTAFSPAVRYLGSNENGFDAKLTVTLDSIERVKYRSGIVVVYPEDFGVELNVSSNSLRMGQNIIYSATGSTGSGVNNYLWSGIPGIGSTSGSLLTTISYSADDWYSVSGTYLGAPNSSFVGNPSLSAYSNAGNYGSSSKSVEYKKIGLSESINYADLGTYLTSGSYYDPEIMSVNSSSISGMGGSNIIIRINQGGYPNIWDNSYFHSTDEAVYFYPNNSDLDTETNKFRIILNGSMLDQLQTIEGYPMKKPSKELDSGNYITPGFISFGLYDGYVLTDYVTTGDGGSISNIAASVGIGNRDWSTSAIVDYMKNYYYFSGSSKFIENYGYFGNKAPICDLASVVAYDSNVGGYNWSGTGGTAPASMHGVCVPSSSFFSNYYGYDGVVDLDVTITDDYDSIISSFTVVLSDSGNAGNSYDGNLILAQNTSYNTVDGIATLLNNEISTQGISSNLAVNSEPWMAPYENGGNQTNKKYDNNIFYGIRVGVTDPYIGSDMIHNIYIGWGSGYLSTMEYLVSNGVPTSEVSILSRAFSQDITQKRPKSWTGLRYPISRPGTGTYFKGFKIGGEL